jgi:hypothetical protein
MQLTARTGRRIAAVAAAAGAAALVPAVALAAPSAPSAVAECAPGAVHAFLGLGQPEGAAGHFFFPIEFTNTGRTTCWIAGSPAVQAVSGGASRATGPAAKAGGGAHVNLGPGATAHDLLSITDVGVFGGSCKKFTADGLNISLPARAGGTVRQFTFTGCTNKAFLAASAISGGVGVP